MRAHTHTGVTHTKKAFEKKIHQIKAEETDSSVGKSLPYKYENLSYIPQTHVFKKARETPLCIVAHAFNPRTPEAEVGGSLELEASLVYKARSKKAGLHRETLSKNITKTNQPTNKKKVNSV